MSARDELVEIVADAITNPQHGEFARDSLRVATRLIEAGYRKPRRIKRLAELEALPAESAVQTSDTSDTVVLKGGDGLFVNAFGGEVSAETLWSFGTKPFTVIYEPADQ